MALPIATAAIAGTAAAAAYLDAKFHLRHDLLHSHSLETAAAAAQSYIEQQYKADKLRVYHIIEKHALADRHNTHLFLECEGRSWTYRQFYEDLQRVGNWLINDLGIAKGEIVALSGPNSAEYLMLWFALDGIGASISFINPHLTGAPLVHCVTLCKPHHLIADAECETLISPCQDELSRAGVATTYYTKASISTVPAAKPIPPSRNTGLLPTDTHSLIYTSGTTGLPKGVIMMNGRVLNTARSIAEYLKLEQTDKFYTCLPVYHAAAQGLCITPVIFAGASVCVSRKFSHKTFWPEVSASGANRLQYIGEIGRYLVNAPPHPLERKHNLHEAWGNGMRPDVWEIFRTRFNVPVIHELYAATDGMGATFNRNEGPFTANAIGLRGWIWNRRNAGREVRAKIDPDTEDIIRGEDGFVVKVDAGEPGETLHKVDPAMAEAAFKGYFQNPSATNKRWLKDVFAPGDLYFRSGDVLRVDPDGKVYFVDRLGDTFRWKSENVSTNEVADVLGTFHHVAEANVYGISVPRSDGRCGCAIIVASSSTTVESFDYAGLAKHAIDGLPRYAVPIFLRMATEIAYTGTFKIQKGQAKREGVDPDMIEKAGSTDKVYWLPPGTGAYVPFAREDWAALKAGRVKL